MSSGQSNPISTVWLDIIQKIGIPTAGLIFVTYALWYVGTNFVQPMYEKQVKLIDRLDESVDTIARAVEANAAADANQTRLLDELAELQTGTLNEVKRAADAATSHSAKLDKIAEEITKDKGGGT